RQNMSDLERRTRRIRLRSTLRVPADCHVTQRYVPPHSASGSPEPSRYRYGNTGVRSTRIFWRTTGIRQPSGACRISDSHHLFAAGRTKDRIRGGLFAVIAPGRLPDRGLPRATHRWWWWQTVAGFQELSEKNNA